jgi:hypothetical protein
MAELSVAARLSLFTPGSKQGALAAITEISQQPELRRLKKDDSASSAGRDTP